MYSMTGHSGDIQLPELPARNQPFKCNCLGRLYGTDFIYLRTRENHHPSLDAGPQSLPLDWGDLQIAVIESRQSVSSHGCRVGSQCLLVALDS